MKNELRMNKSHRNLAIISENNKLIFAISSEENKNTSEKKNANHNFAAKNKSFVWEWSVLRALVYIFISMEIGDNDSDKCSNGP